MQRILEEDLVGVVNNLPCDVFLYLLSFVLTAVIKSSRGGSISQIFRNRTVCRVWRERVELFLHDVYSKDDVAIGDYPYLFNKYKGNLKSLDFSQRCFTQRDLE